MRELADAAAGGTITNCCCCCYWSWWRWCVLLPVCTVSLKRAVTERQWLWLRCTAAAFYCYCYLLLHQHHCSCRPELGLERVTDDRQLRRSAYCSFRAGGLIMRSTHPSGPATVPVGLRTSTGQHWELRWSWGGDTAAQLMV
jgi:hypothetical protein